MDCAKVGELIRSLRKEKGMTQQQLADIIRVSGKTVSKWERGGGCPDVSLLTELSAVLGCNIEEILEGELPKKRFVNGNMKRVLCYVCPVCGNVTCCTGNAVISCCGRRLEPLTPQKSDEAHRITVEQSEDDWYITTEHPMEKSRYLSFFAFATGDKFQILKQYPEWTVQLRLPKREHGRLFWYCTVDGLFYQDI